MQTPAAPRQARSAAPSRPPGQRLFLSCLEAGAVVVVIALGWIHWRVGGRWGTAWFTDLLEAAVPIVAAGLCIRAGRGLTGRDRRAWRLLGLAAVAWAVGQLVWSYLELVTHRHPFPSAADLFYGASFPLAVIALLSFEASPSGVGARLRAVVEGLMACVSVFFVGWTIALGPSFRSATGSLLPKLVSTASPGTDVVLVALAVMVAARARNFRPFAFIAGGIVSLAAADTASALTVLRGGRPAPGLIDIGWILGFLLVALGAVTPGRASGGVRGSGAGGGAALEGGATHEIRRSRLQGLIVYIAWPVVLGIGVWETVHGQQLEPVLKWSAIAMAALGLTRQVLATRESQALARDLERKVRDRTAELAEREERFRSLLQNSSDVVMLLDAGLTIRYVTDSAERILGRDPKQLVGSPLGGLLEDGSGDEVLAKLGEVARRNGSTAMVQFRLRRATDASGTGGWVELESMVANLLEAPAVGALVLTARDIGERVEFEGKLRTLAFHDSLTGLPNRSLFRDTVSEALARRDDGRRGNCAVMILDLDRFKNVNDSLGHHVGDQLLIAAARRIEGALRAGDMVARVGGDEFAVLIHGVDAERQAVAVANRLLAALDVPFHVGDRDVLTPATIGLAMATDGSSVEDLLANADVAMYRAKSSGRNCYDVFRPAMHQAVVARMELEEELRRALAREEFVVHYQPIVDLRRGSTVGVEALVRWQHPTRGLLAPGEFIGLAEETGLIVPLGRWVLREACGQVAAWQRDGVLPGLRVSVNLSSRQLQEANLEVEVAGALRAARLDSADLLLEITESLMVDDSDQIMGRLRGLCAAGVRLAIDDFGTGYSSLAYVSRLPVQVLKIDRSFVQEMGRSVEATAVVRAILSLATSLGFSVVAEGIEDPDQLAELARLGCRFGQGYHFARPLPAEALVAFLAESPKPEPLPVLGNLRVVGS